MNQDKIEKGFLLFGKVMLVAVIVFNIFMIYKCYFNFLNADDGSELVYCRMLATDGGILSHNWYYSTELEILNTELIYSFLFRFISNFKMVRILGQTILTIIFMATYYFCLYSIDKTRSKSRFWKTAFILAIPISPAWIFLIMKSYYVPHIAISFAALGFACQVQKEDLTTKKQLIVILIGCLLAFVGCLEGIRHIQFTYLPLVLSTVWIIWNSLEKVEWNLEKWHLPRGFGAEICWFFSACAGCLVNMLVLNNIYDVDSYESEKFTETLSLENIQNVFNAFLEVTGYAGEQEMLSAGGICNALAVVFLCVIIYFGIKVAICLKQYEPIEQFVFAFSLMSFAISMFIYIVLNNVQPRWVMLCVVTMIFFVFLLEKIPYIKGYLLLACFYFGIFILGAREYHTLWISDRNENLREVYEFIMSSDYTYGYATFRASNLMTELTNGKFESYTLKGDFENQKLAVRHWLRPIQVEYKDGPFLCILEKQRVEGIPMPEEAKLALEVDDFIVYEFPNHQKFDEYLNQKELKN